jgi:predicted O-methyltransferase YrrM
MSKKFTKENLEEYLRELYRDDDPVREAMETLAQELNFPIVGPLAGKVLYQLSLMIGAKRVFELGSGYGYSALFFARAVGENGQVHCTDFSTENIDKAKDFLGRAGLWPRITYHQEDAIAALRRVGGTWDVIYNDIQKTAYPETVELAYQHLRPGGLFISDNLFRGGLVFEQAQDAATQSVLEFTRRLFAHPGFVTSINPVRDGLSVAWRR